MGETLQSVQEAWLKMEVEESRRKSLLIKSISSAELVNTHSHKIAKRVSSKVTTVCEAIRTSCGVFNGRSACFSVAGTAAGSVLCR